MSPLRCRSGLTLVELLVTLALIGVVTGVVGLAFRAAPPLPDGSEVQAAVAAARRQALTARRPVTTSIRVAEGVHSVTALPDGSVLVDSLLRVDPLTGRPLDAR